MTGTSPAARSGATSRFSASPVSSVKGAAAVYWSSVTIALRASTHAVSIPAAWSAPATTRLLRSSPAAAMPSQERGEASRKIASAVSIARSSSICCSTSATTAVRPGRGTSASTAARWRFRISSTPLEIVARSPREASAVIRSS